MRLYLPTTVPKLTDDDGSYSRPLLYYNDQDLNLSIAALAIGTIFWSLLFAYMTQRSLSLAASYAGYF